MANHSQGKFWSPSLLKTRGWTNELIDKLLPKPRYRRINGRSLPMWHRDDVRAAEETDLFKKKSRPPKPSGQAAEGAREAAQTVAHTLDSLWKAAPKGDEPAWVLAEYYHQVITHQLPVAAKGRPIRPNQASAFLNQFLSLERRCDPDQLPADLTHFVQAGVWMGDNLTGEGEGDDEQIEVDLTVVPANIERIAFTCTIYDAERKRQNFGQVQNAFIRIVDEVTGQEIIRYDLGEDFSIETAIVVGELYRRGGEWKFNAIGSGFQGGLAALCGHYGIEVA